MEAAATLMLGGHVILLHPNGDLNVSVWCETISCQQVTYLNILPSVMLTLVDHLRCTKNTSCLKTLRYISSEGKEALSNNLMFTI